MIVSDIIKAVASHFYIHEKDLVGPAKFGFLIPGRFALYKILRERGMSLPHIGYWCNGRDHTTIRYGIERAEYMMDKDAEYRSFIESMISHRVVFAVPESMTNGDQNNRHMTI